MSLESLSPLDSFASDIISNYSRESRRNVPDLHRGFLLRVLLDDIKTSSTAIKIAVDGVNNTELYYKIHQGGDGWGSFTDLSLSTALEYSDYLNHDRTLIELATAYWTLGSTTRLSHKQIIRWDEAERDKLSEFRAEEARRSISRGHLIIDPYHGDGEYVVYQLPSGVYQLLESGLEIVKSHSGKLHPKLAKDFAKSEIGESNYLVF